MVPQVCRFRDLPCFRGVPVVSAFTGIDVATCGVRSLADDNVFGAIVVQHASLVEAKACLALSPFLHAMGIGAR